nr:MAG TPA: hypothetical protein [Bacteriophage sp.]
MLFTVLPSGSILDHLASTTATIYFPLYLKDTLSLFKSENPTKESVSFFSLKVI